MKDKIPVITNLIRTCYACPSQWEGKLEDGRMIYIRYHHGWLSVRVSSSPTEEIRDAIRGEEIFSKVNEDEGGFMEYEELVRYAGHMLDFNNLVLNGME